MIFLPQSIPDIFLIKPTLNGDNRGFFAETFRQDLLDQAIGNESGDIDSDNHNSENDTPGANKRRRVTAGAEQPGPPGDGSDQAIGGQSTGDQVTNTGVHLVTGEAQATGALDGPQSQSGRWWEQQEQQGAGGTAEAGAGGAADSAAEGW